MGYPLFYEDDIPFSTRNIEEVAKHFGIEVTDTEIWHIVRQKEEIPHVGNEYLEELYSRLQEVLEDRFPEIQIQYEANALASYFNVNGQSVDSLSELMRIIEED